MEGSTILYKLLKASLFDIVDDLISHTHAPAPTFPITLNPRYLGEHGQVELSAGRHVKVLVAGEQGRGGGGEGALAVQLCRQVVPVLQADLEDLRLLYLRHQQHVVQGLR